MAWTVLRKVCKQKTELYTIWQIGWFPVQGNWLGLWSSLLYEDPCDLQVKLVIIILQTSNNKVFFLVTQVWACHMQIVD